MQWYVCQMTRESIISCCVPCRNGTLMPGLIETTIMRRHESLALSLHRITHKLQNALCSRLPVLQSPGLRHVHDLSQGHSLNPSVLQHLQGHSFVGAGAEPLLFLLQESHVWLKMQTELENRICLAHVVKSVQRSWLYQLCIAGFCSTSN